MQFLLQYDLHVVVIFYKHACKFKLPVSVQKHINISALHVIKNRWERWHILIHQSCLMQFCSIKYRMHPMTKTDTCMLLIC